MWSFKVLSANAYVMETMCNYSSTCCHAGELGMWRQFSFQGSWKAQASPWPWGEPCHLLAFLYKSCLCQPARASTDLSGEKQAELRRAVKQLGRTVWFGAREMLVSGKSLTHCQHHSCLLALPAPAPGTAITVARYTRHCWLLLQGAWVKIALSKLLSVWFLFEHLCNIN